MENPIDIEVTYKDNLPLVIKIEKEKYLVINKDEALGLYDYFYKRAGYISTEFDMPVINFTNRLDKYVQEVKFQDAIRETEG